MKSRLGQLVSFPTRGHFDPAYAETACAVQFTKLLRDLKHCFALGKTEYINYNNTGIAAERLPTAPNADNSSPSSIAAPLLYAGRGSHGATC